MKWEPQERLREAIERARMGTVEVSEADARALLSELDAIQAERERAAAGVER